MRRARLALGLGLVLAMIAAASQVWGAGSQWSVQSSPNPGTTTNILRSVSTRSSTDAWAVGCADDTGGGFICLANSLIEHYDGSTWQQVPAPAPGHGSSLYGVKATSSTNAWAVGTYEAAGGAGPRTLIDHFDGTSWTRQSSPNVQGLGNYLYGVAAASSTSAWAVGTGYYFSLPPVIAPIVEHFDGTSWRLQRIPEANGDVLNGVAAPGPSNVWAVGSHGGALTEILHYDGTKWRLSSSPNRGTSSDLQSVSFDSGTDGWAVGSYDATNGNTRTLILHYDGTSWKVVASPSRGSVSYLYGVKAITAGDVWATGAYKTTGGILRTLILHYDGTSWTRQASPNVGTNDNELLGIGGSSSTNVFTVGYSDTGLDAPSSNAFHTLVLHCC